MLFAGLLIAVAPSSMAWAQTQETASASAEPLAQTEAAVEKPVEAQPRLVGSNLGIPGKLGKAVASAPEGSGKGRIDPNTAPGYLGIPGGKQVSLIVAFLWSIWVFSTVGAFGGVLAGVGHISVFGLGAYAKTFKDSAPELNKFVTDSIRVSNQWLVGLSAAVSSSNYAKQKRLIVPLGVSLGLGSLLAAYLVVYTTMGKIKFSEYQGYFGLIVFIIGGFMIYEMTPWGQSARRPPSRLPRLRGHDQGKRRHYPVRRKDHPVQPRARRDLLFRADIHLQPNLGLRRRFFYQRHLVFNRCGRRLPVRAVSDQRRGPAHVRGGRDLGPGCVDQHDPVDLQLHGQGRDGILDHDRRGTDRHFHWVDDRPAHGKIHS